MELSDHKQESFARQVAIDLASGRKPNYSQAAIHAGYGEISAANRGSRLARSHRIAARIAEIQAAHEQNTPPSSGVIADPCLDTPDQRVAAMRGRWRDLYAIAAARAVNPLYARVPGGRTGWLIRTGRSAYKLDIDLLKEIRAIEEQVSVELGQHHKQVVARQPPVSVFLTDAVGLNTTLRQQLGALAPAEREKIIEMEPDLADVLSDSESDPPVK